MDLLGLEIYTNEKNIPIDDFYIAGQKGMCVKYNGKYRIVLKSKLIECDQERKLVLAHELGHCETDMFYYIQDLQNPLYNQNILKAEKQAAKKSYEFLVPVDDLKRALKRTKDVYELAEIFDVTEIIIKNAVAYYKRKGLLKGANR